MSVKRSATTDLNHDNWDQEDPSEHEEMGTFKAAPKDVIEKRVIRTAKRRFQGSSDESKKSAFSNFGGFNKAQPSSFDFLANLTNGSKNTNGTGTTKSDSAIASSLFSVKPGISFDSNSSKPSATQPSSLFGTAHKMEIPTMTFSNSKADSTVPDTFKMQGVTNSAVSSVKSTAPASNVFGTSTPKSDSPFKIQGVTNSADSSMKTTAPVASNVFGSSAPKSDSQFKMQGITNSADSSMKTTAPVASNVFGASAPKSDSPFKIQGVKDSADSNMKATAPISTNTFATSVPNSNQIKSTSSAFKPTTSTIPAQNTTSTPVSISTTDANKQTDIEKARNKYYSKLKGLNESVSSWIVQHVEKTPLCFLTPIFKDYENYLKEILGEYEAAKQEIQAKGKEMEAKPMFGINNQISAPSKLQDSPTPSFGINNASTNNTSSSGAFGTQSSSLTTTSSSAPAKGFSFGVTPAPATSGSTLFTTKEKPSSMSSQGFSFGASSAASDPVSPPNKGFSFGITSTPSTNSGVTASNSTVSPQSKGFSFGTTSSPSNTNSAFATNTSLTPPNKGFSFEAAPSATSPTNASLPFASGAATSPAGGLFGINSTSSANTGGAAPFSFGIGGAKPFSFNSQTQQSTNADTKNENDEDQPPKVEYTPLVEENSVFDKKCKMFVKKDGTFVDKGVSTLYIKKIEESGKHQLLVRANTSLGTVLLNLILSSAVPTQRMGKNNVMLVCIPTPDAKPPPTPVLIRVKTGEEADELLENLNKHKS